MKLARYAPALLAVALVACAPSTQSAGTTSAPPTGSNAPAESTPAETTTSEAAVNPKFGETYTWDDGLAVTVSTPAPYTLSDSGYVGNPGAAQVAFDVKVVNTGTANYEVVGMYLSLQSGNVEAEQIFDTANGLGGAPSTPVLPGREAVFKVGFGVADPVDLVMQVTPGFDYEAVIFTS